MTSRSWSTSSRSFFAGIALAAAAHFSARRLGRPGEIAAVLGLPRTGVIVVGAGTVLVLVSGLWLIEETGRSLGDGWIAGSLGLLAPPASSVRSAAASRNRLGCSPGGTRLLLRSFTPCSAIAPPSP
jgi:Predicted integral membrane protein (DUF2269)